MDKLNQPQTVLLDAGKTYFFCTCGLSAKYPFCDGAHKTSGTGKRSLSYECMDAKTVTYVDGAVKE
jgi:CDGSH-type Zn-finger protein